MLSAARYRVRFGLCLGLAMTGQVALAQQLNPDVYPPKVAEVIKHSVVRLGDARSSGTGFLVSNQGHIVTAWHVLESINKRGDPNRSISYVRSNYWVNFAGSGNDCNVQAALIGASDFRDIAVMRVKPQTWAVRNEEGNCLNGVRPVEIDWHLDPEQGTQQAEYPYASESHYPIGFPAKCADWTRDTPTWAGNGDRFQCPLRGFNAFKTGVRRAEDELGLIELSEAVEHGFSGGPVILENGRVVGMTILRDWEEKNAVSRLVPSPMLEGPLWTFGVAVDKRNRVLGDHHQAMLDYISRKDDLVHALEAFEEMYSFLSIPELLEDQSRMEVVKQNNEEDAIYPVFMFERRWANAPNPTKFDVIHSCVPKDRELASVLFLGHLAVKADELRNNLFRDFSYEMEIPKHLLAASRPAGSRAGGIATQDLRYALEVSGSMAARVEQKMLLAHCKSLQRMLLNDVIREYKISPDRYYLIDRDGNKQLSRVGATIKGYIEDQPPDFDSDALYKEIVFSISVVFKDGNTEKLRHRYEKVVLPVVGVPGEGMEMDHAH